MTKYLAKINGTIVGKRTTKSRKYTHAVVVQAVEEVARAKAYGFTSTEADSRNFEYESIIAQGRSPYAWNQTPEAIARAQAEVEGGFDAYVRRLRERAIKSFEAAKASGGFEPTVATWCGSLGLAHKAVGTFTGPSTKLVAIVPTEEA